MASMIVALVTESSLLLRGASASDSTGVILLAGYEVVLVLSAAVAARNGELSFPIETTSPALIRAFLRDPPPDQALASASGVTTASASDRSGTGPTTTTRTVLMPNAELLCWEDVLLFGVADHHRLVRRGLSGIEARWNINGFGLRTPVSTDESSTSSIHSPNPSCSASRRIPASARKNAFGNATRTSPSMPGEDELSRAMLAHYLEGV